MGVWTTAVKDWVTGAVVTEADLDAQIRDPWNAFGAWQSYTPIVAGYTSVTTTVSGAFTQIQKMVWFRGQVQLATVTTLGSSSISFSLPVTAASTLATQAHGGTLQYRTNAGALVAGVMSFSAGASTFTLLIPTPGGATPNLTRATGAAPAGQVVGDIWTFNGFYEAA